MRILVTGGREFTDQGRVFQELDARHFDTPVELIIEGGAQGVDRQARYWALEKGIPCMTFHACWDALGRAVAIPARNEWMIKYGQPDLCLAFPGGSGTLNMKNTAHKLGILVLLAE
jgi:hypothetical protein